MLKRVCQKLHEHSLQRIKVVIADAVRAVHVAYQKARVQSEIHRIVSADKRAGLFAAKVFLHTAVKQKMLVAPQNAEQARKVFFEVGQSLDDKNVRVFALVNFLRLRGVCNNRNNAAVMQPWVRIDSRNYSVTVNFF